MSMNVLLEFNGTLATGCDASGTHNPRPLRHVWHHIQPHEAGGATVAANLVQVCDSCFTYDMPVGGNAERASRRWYSGDLVEVRLNDGRKLTGTPNHPVLTAYGWMPLGALQQGHELIAHHRDVEPIMRVGDVDRLPAVISQVFDALSVASPVGVTGTGMDLHGERPGGNVDVVSTNSQLRRDLDLTAGQFAGNGTFPAADAEPDLLSGQRYADQLILAALASSGGSVSGGSVSSPLFRGHLAHADGVSVAAATTGHAVTLKERTDGVGADTTGPGDAVLGFPSDVALYQVTGVSRFPFAGHVFNLQTETGLYTANGIVVHNCHYSIHRIMWVMAQIALGKPVTDAQRATITQPPRHTQRDLAGRGYEACVAAGTVAQIPNEG